VYTEIREGDDGSLFGGQIAYWEIINYYMNSDTSGKWAIFPPMPPERWEYEFPPVIHWQNLPLAGSVYGRSDIEDVIEVQDRLNFVASNISKIIRYHSHPKTWGRGQAMGNKASWGPDEMVLFNTDNAMLANLEMQSDLGAAQKYLLYMRQALFDITRTVDVTSFADRLGALTNFGLRVLFMDALAKLNTKQELYGEAFVELNHRMLTIGGFKDTDGGAVVWPDVLPKNELEDMAGDKFELDYGLVSKRTLMAERGRDFEIEGERMGAEATEAQANENNIGALLLRNFEQGR
jgi:hypothetical protein